jgi:hypothetical protein
MKFDERNQKLKKNPPFFYFHGNCVKVCPTDSDFFSGHHPTSLFWHLGFHGNAILNFINTSKASTHYSEYSYDVS